MNQGVLLIRIAEDGVMVKERCDGTPQLNLRVPLEHHERVHKLVALLQSTKAFAARLDELIATASEPPKTLFYPRLLTG